MRLINVQFIFLVSILCVFQQVTILSAYDEAHLAKVNVDALYKTLSSKILTLKMRLNQTKEKVAKTSHELVILKKVKTLLEELTKHKPCEHEYLLLDYRHKQAITIEAVSEIPAHYTVTLQVNHKALVDEHQADQKNGDDLRVFYLPRKGSLPVEIDRLVENTYTNTTTVRFRTQKAIPAGMLDLKSYALVFGGKYSEKVKADQRNVFAFYETFDGSTLDGWSNVWGEWSIKNGRVFGKTGTSSHGSGEIGIYLKQGQDWEDVEVELDLMETGANVVFPGPLLRVMNPSLQHTTAWWFEYYTDHKECTMRPFKNNKDGGWKYKCNLPEKLVKNKWYHFKYRIIGDKIMQWANGKLIQDATVDNDWLVSKGTIALGCHTIYKGSPTGCRTYYDNIKVQLLAKHMPKVSLGKNCNVAHGGKKAKLGEKENPASSCREIYESIVAEKRAIPSNGAYWIKTAANRKNDVYQTFCDMKKGGWTLVGKISGRAGNIYGSWLVRNVNVDLLKSPKITSGNVKYGCLDARLLAVKCSSEIMLSSGDNSMGVGNKWVRWQLPAGREYNTWWNYAVGYTKVSSAGTSTVTVHAWNGKTKVCYQNKYGIMPLQQHGGSYPYASINKQGNTSTKDLCMAVGVLLKSSKANGWTQNANGYDSPQSDSDWPNKAYNHQQPYLLVWLK